MFKPETNTRSVIASLNMGGGLAKLEKFCTAMNLPAPITKKPFNKHLRKIEKAAEEHTHKSLQDAGNRLREKLTVEHGYGVDDTMPCTVSVDGTWQKRGHTSKIGVVFILSVETNEALDYEIKSLVCHECRSHDLLDKEGDEYKAWYAKHKVQCLINHNDSSDAMEHEAAVLMFSRSIEKHNLKYTTFVGDGDSKTFGVVRKGMLEKYGDSYAVVKVDCIGHVQKRMGSNLRAYKNKNKGLKLSDGKGVGGKGRLTDVVINRMQNYYGQAIRSNVGKVENMKEAVWAIFSHMIEDCKETMEKQHEKCPAGDNSWCKYKKDKALGTSLYKPQNRLPHVFKTELLSIFQRRLIMNC